MIRLDYDDLVKIEHLNQRRVDLDIPLPHSTCCDYVDSLTCDAGVYTVTMFVEPCGNITKRGKSWPAILDWWIEVFRMQPADWDYCRAGWHLYEISYNKPLPEDPALVWPIDCTCSACRMSAIIDKRGVSCNLTGEEEG